MAGQAGRGNSAVVLLNGRMGSALLLRPAPPAKRGGLPQSLGPRPKGKLKPGRWANGKPWHLFRPAASAAVGDAAEGAQSADGGWATGKQTRNTGKK
jgi:hypothetical protein